MCAAVFAGLHTTARAQEAQGTFATIREDVRSDSPPSAFRESADRQPAIYSGESSESTADDPYGNVGVDSAGDDAWSDFWLATFTFPFWVPHAALEGNGWIPGRFLSYPYEKNQPGWMGMDLESPARRPWAVRFGTEWFEPFDNTQGITSHLLIDTQTRFGLDASTTWLEERLRGGSYDHLVLGDCNLTFRFAQSPWIQFRTGLGLNWLTDAARTDLGFNFTYGVEVFPCKPWVMTAVLDWGTLGRAELFRFRTTVGASFYGIEAYTGFEYLDIDRTQLPGLLAGVQIRR